MSNDNRPAGQPVPSGWAPGAQATPVTLAASLVVLTAVLGFFDGTGLGAPVNWVDAGFVLPGGPQPSFPVPHAASQDGSGLLALTVLRRPGEPPVIGDSLGRPVLLCGVNVNQLVDYGRPRRSPLSARSPRPTTPRWRRCTDSTCSG